MDEAFVIAVGTQQTKVCSKCSEERAITDYYPSNGKPFASPVCKPCYNKRCREWQKANRDRTRIADKKWRAANLEKAREKGRRWHRENRAHSREVAKRWYYSNLEKQSERARRWRKLNPNSIRALAKARYALKRRATPNNLSKEEKDIILQIYKNCPQGYHVDHIVPLKGKTVSGLHVPWNLQYLPAVENLRKGNKLLEKFLNADSALPPLSKKIDSASSR